MTLSKRLVSLLLIYCFVIATVSATASGSSSDFRLPPIVGQFPTTQSATQVGALAPVTRVFNFLSSLFWSTESNVADVEINKEERGLRFRLSEAPDQPEAKPESKIAEATILSDAETQAVLSRLPAIKSEPGDETEFALRERSLPAPRTGAIVMQPFPAASELARPPETAAGPLEVVRFSPEGDVPVAPNLSITFSQPMVAVTSQEEAAEFVPVKLSPQPPGKWHWIGTKTLLFEPEIRFPMATQYSISISAGTKSAAGAKLLQAKSWSFATPPPAVKTFYPTRSSVQRRDVLMFAEFDQRIDAATVLKHLDLEGDNKRINLRLATKEEIDKNVEVRDLVKRAQPNRWVALRAVDVNGQTDNALPAAANVNVTVLAGTPSAEGPRVTQQAQAFPFRTFGPLRLVKSYCSYPANSNCLPDESWVLEFSNPLRVEDQTDERVRIEPPLPNAHVTVYSNTLRI
jgi:hypothetical protein